MPAAKKLFERARIEVADGTDHIQRAVDRAADACLGALESTEAGTAKIEGALGRTKEGLALAAKGLPLRAEALVRRLARLIEAHGPAPLDSLAVPLDNIATLVGGYSLPSRERITRFWQAPPSAEKPQAA